MKVMRFVGRTSRDAMRKLRDTLGPDALVLANRPCAEGVELLAAAPGELGALPSADRENAWKALCRRTEEVGKMKAAKVWLKKAIAEEDARRTQSTPDHQAA